MVHWHPVPVTDQLLTFVMEIFQSHNSDVCNDTFDVPCYTVYSRLVPALNCLYFGAMIRK